MSLIEGRGLCKEGESWKGLRIWKSFPSRSYRRQFSSCLYQSFIENGGQGIINSNHRGTPTVIWSRGFGVCYNGQGLLFSCQCAICEGTNRECRWPPTARQYKESGCGPPEARVIQSKSWGGTPHRTCQTIWIRQKQDEVRQGHTRLRVSLCHRIQLASINERPTGWMHDIEGLSDKKIWKKTLRTGKSTQMALGTF